MKYRKLGNSELEVSVICYGAWAIGGDSYGDVDDHESIKSIHAALDEGINFIDTAPIYGQGHSEEIVGRALSTTPRDQVIIATKFGLVGDKQGNVLRNSSASNIRKEVEDSLRRLATDYIDLYQVHWPDPNFSLEETAETLKQLQQEGKIRYIGVSNFSKDEMERFMTVSPIHSLQPPYHLLARDVEKDILPFCQKHNIGVITYGSLGHGLFGGKMSQETFFAENDMRRGMDIFQGQKFKQNLKLVNKLKLLAESYGKTVGQLAISWVLAQPGITSAIVGAKKDVQVRENAAAGEWELSNEILEKINDLFAGIETNRAYVLD